MKKQLLLGALLGAWMSVSAAVPALTPQNVTLTNGNFKTTGLSGWTTTGDTWSDKSESSAPDGNYVRIVKTAGDLVAGSMISQTVTGMNVPGTYVLTAVGSVTRNNWGGNIDTVGKGKMFGCLYVSDSPLADMTVDSPGFLKIGETGGTWTTFTTMITVDKADPTMVVAFGIPSMSQNIPKGIVRVDKFELTFYPTLDQDAVKAYIDKTDYTMVESISLSETQKVVKGLDPFSLTATALPANCTNGAVTWSSSDTNVATVDENGNVTPKALGSCAIVATSVADPSISSSCQLTVEVAKVNVESVSVAVKEGNPEIEETKTLQLICTVLPADASIPGVTWSSSAPDVATVNENGLVTAVKAGKVTIAATSVDDSSKSGSIELTVFKNAVSSITLQEAATIEQGKSLALTATVNPENATYPTVTWTSSNEEVATVDSNGNVTAIKAGKANITATADGVSAVCEVTVLYIDVENVSLSATEGTIVVGGTVALTATVTPDNATEKDIVWESANPAVATVDQNGTVTGVATGETTISATIGGKSATYKVCVVEALELQSTSVELVNPLFEASTWSEGWTVTGEEWVVKVERNDQPYGGKYYARLYKNPLSAGDEGKFVMQSVTVEKPGTYALSAYVRASQNHYATRPLSEEQYGLLFITDDATAINPDNAISSAKVRTIDWNWEQATVYFTTTKENTTLTVGYGIPKESAEIPNGNLECSAFELRRFDTFDTNAVKAFIEKQAYTMVESVSLPESLEITEGEELPIAAVVNPADATNPALTWTSSDPAVATVDNEGNVTAVAVGEAVITATSAADLTTKASCKVTVKAAYIPVESVTIESAEIEVEVGVSVQLQATVNPSNATEPDLTWSSSDETIASVDNNGLVKGLRLGEAIITAKAGDKTAQCKVVVTIATGISEIFDSAEGDIEIYDLTGKLVNDRPSELKTGVYIVRQGSKTAKVYVK